LTVLSQQQLAADARHCAAQAATSQIRQLSEQVREAELIAAAATATSAASTGAQSERQRLRAEADARAATVADLEGQARQAADGQEPAREVVAAADAVVEEADQLLAAAQQRAETGRRVVDQLFRRDEAERLTARLAKIDAAQCDRDRICDELFAISL